MDGPAGLSQRPQLLRSQSDWSGAGAGCPAVPTLPSAHPSPCSSAMPPAPIWLPICPSLQCHLVITGCYQLEKPELRTHTEFRPTFMRGHLSVAPQSSRVHGKGILTRCLVPTCFLRAPMQRPPRWHLGRWVGGSVGGERRADGSSARAAGHMPIWCRPPYVSWPVASKTRGGTPLSRPMGQGGAWRRQKKCFALWGLGRSPKTMLFCLPELWGLPRLPPWLLKVGMFMSLPSKHTSSPVWE